MSLFFLCLVLFLFLAVWWIRDILVRIRMRIRLIRRVPLYNGSGCGPGRTKTSLADPGCLSRILIFTHPGSRISDPKTAMKEIGEKKFLSYLFFGVINFTKLNYFILNCWRKKIWANFQRIIELFTQKIVSKLSKNIGLGSGILKKPIPDPGSRGQKGTGSRIRIRNTDQTSGSGRLGKSHKEVKVFLTFFAWWWKGPKPDPYLWLTDPDAAFSKAEVVSRPSDL